MHLVAASPWLNMPGRRTGQGTISRGNIRGMEREVWGGEYGRVKETRKNAVFQENCTSTGPLAWSKYLKAQTRGSMKRRLGATPKDKEMPEPGAQTLSKKKHSPAGISARRPEISLRASAHREVESAIMLT